eukprot:CAMPEP_0172496900 /NCGR_PEP_ID=MMETSP1066-20121228/94676_1 /TAXON_ID=671091 /ORGANISM="Coscinodiscus wailesii, Strain CCMP2513" /LENGTH=390 /DNA_ID=CAMNT_0013269443 /DNA_START=24 /DNA_END=1196 /DNA_ORIENTATION=+
MRILCLHGGHSSAAFLRADLFQLEQRLYQNHNIELVYVNSPICDDGSYDTDTHHQLLTAADGTADCEEALNQLVLSATNTVPVAPPRANDSIVPHNHETNNKNLSKKKPLHQRLVLRQWFADTPTSLSQPPSSDDGSDDDTSCYYVGMDASLLHLIQIWNRDIYSRPFSGIIAFHQGGALAGLLPLLGNKFQGLDFMVLANGYVLHPLPSKGCMGLNLDDFLQNEVLVDGVETLHLIDKSDTKASRRLAKMFVKRTIHKYSSDNVRCFPHKPKDLNVMGKFIIARKNAIKAKQGPNARLILETQQKLHSKTLAATDLICETVAMNPPKALMAIIAPNALGGWSGPKIRDPTDGGGAPCPREFVMREHEREKEWGIRDVGREHPNKTGAAG